jgi:UMF1 family MFS transporter
MKGGGLLRRLALHRPELRAWALYDWANSGMITVIVTAVFPIFFARVAWVERPGWSAAEVHGLVTTASLVLVALLAPLLGVVADRSGSKKRLLGAFAVLGALACGGMFFVRPGDWPLAGALFLLANLGASASFVFYDALLPHVAREEEVDRLSTSAFALGYLGGGLLLALDLLLIQDPGRFGLPSGPDLDPHAASLPARIAFVGVGLWWLGFSVPLLRGVPEPPVPAGAVRLSIGAALVDAVGGLRRTLRDLLGYREAALMLLAFLIYNDGITTVFRMAAVYGAELELEAGRMMTALLLVQFVGVPATFAFGALAARTGARPAILIGLAVYGVVGVMAYRLDSADEFLAMSVLIALVQGGTQALSRSLFASLIPAARSGEFFGFFAVFDRFAGILGPLLFTQVLAWTGEVRSAVLPLLGFFAVGAAVLTRVDVARGRARVRSEREAARAEA